MNLENYIDSDGASIWTVRGGEGFPVVLCSGGPGCCDYLEPVARMLDDAAQIVRFEERGCGRSQALPPYDIEISLRDLENVREFYEIDRWIVGGHSWGADLALFYALKYPARTAGLMCIAGGRIHNDREWHAEYKRALNETGERMPEFKYPVNMAVNEQVSRSWKRAVQNPDLLRDLSKLETPALFVYAENDIRPAWATKQLTNLMPAARFELVEGAEHLVWLARPSELKALLRNFVGDVKRKETPK